MTGAAGFDMYHAHGGDVHKGSMVSGVGLVHGRPCMLVVNDSTVKGSSNKNIVLGFSMYMYQVELTIQ